MEEEEGKFSTVVKTVLKRVGKIIVVALVKLLPYIIAAIFICSIIAAVIRFIIISNGSYKEGDDTNVPYLVDSEIDKLLDEKQNMIIVKDAIGGGYHYDVDLDKVAEDIITKARDNRTVFDSYISKENQKEYLKAFIKAQLVTQSFNLGNTGENDFNGAIKVKKQKSDGSEEWLTYIDNETFESYVKSGDDNVFKHFTLNSSGQLVVAQSQRETTTVDTNIQGMDTSGEQQYLISETSLDYKAMLDNYVMPFDLLWELLVQCTEEEFVYEVANLAINSEIIITAYENSTTTVQTEETNYDLKEIHNMTVEGETNSRVETRVTEDLNSQKYYVHKTTTINTNNVVLNITYADVWVVKYTNDYSSEPVDSSSESQDETGDENYNITIPARNVPLGSSYANLEASVCKDSERVTKHIVTSQLRKRGANYKINTTGNSYREGPANIEEKTDKDSETENFVTLLKKYPRAEGKLMESPDWLFDMMESSQRTADMVDLMKYLLYKATGVDLGVTSFDFGLYDLSKFNKGGSLGLALYLRQFSHTGEAPQSSDGKYYLMYGDGVGWPTIGNADIQWKSHHAKFNSAGKVLQNGTEREASNVEIYVNSFLTRGAEAKYSNAEISNMQIYIEKELVDKVGDMLCENYYNSVVNATAGISLSQQQLYALTAIAYNFGRLPERNGYSFKTVYEAGAAKYKVNSWEHNRFIWDNWWAYIGGGAAGHIPSRDAAFETYVKGVYDFSQSSAGTVFNRSKYIYYTQSQVDMYSYAPRKTVTRTASNEEEIFTYEAHGGNFSVETVEAAGYVFPHYLQKDYPVPYGSSTIPKSGCGPTSLAMILAGLKGDASITPETLVKNINKQWPDGKYYVSGVGSNWCIFSSDFLQKYYGVTSEPANNTTGLQALEQGYPVIGGETGHILAIIPAPEELKQQGYKFYIMDSARGHDGPYRSISEANAKVSGGLVFTHIIKP